MFYLGLVLGVLIGVILMHLKNTKNLKKIELTTRTLGVNLIAAQDKLKAVKGQLYKRRSSYKANTSSRGNGKKAVKEAVRQKSTINTKPANI